ncbi:hypothetical protein V490_06285 [Pseudogymnoascus sp. VKM F-3557]|nr:hypothetical protein V490_06285 [Pseudogymnoascus sp. VKM F-3557]
MGRDHPQGPVPIHKHGLPDKNTDTSRRGPREDSIARSVDAHSRSLSPMSAAAMNSVKLVTNKDDYDEPKATQTPSKPSSKPSMDSMKVEKQRSIGNISGGNGTNAENRSNATPSTPVDSRLGIPRVSSVRMISAEFGGTKNYSPNIPIAEDNGGGSNGGTPNGQWSSAVGRANLGKSGRVIERLMGENDMLKRDLQIERLHLEEARQAVKMTEERIDVIETDYEGRLHDAAINKTLLKKRERQLADIKDHIDAEKRRADEAVERERTWREAMEKLETESKQKVDEAANYALLMEGRYRALTSHWKEQGEVVDRTVRKLGGEMTALVQERLRDGERLDALQQLCNEQRENLARLQEENKTIAETSKAHRDEQDASLAGIRAKAHAQEKANEDTLAETKAALHKLKWALGVNKNVGTD